MDQAGDIPKAHVDTLSCQGMDSVGCIPADEAELRCGLQQQSEKEELCSAVILPDERQPRPDVLSSMSQPERKQHSAFGIHLGYAWRQLAS